MNTELAAKYDLMVPRYTSYPTAPHFSQSVDSESYLRWLGELDPETPLSLYFHIPFCAEMCWFCGCYTKIVKRYRPLSDYLDLMLDEIALVAAALPSRFTARHLHWGGGSPNRLHGDDFSRVMERIVQAFPLAPAAEVAVEIDPRSFKPGDGQGFAQTGVNRVSLGVQTFQDQVQVAVNRVQPFAMIAAVVEELRGCGIGQINFDLMFGLPYQTTRGVEETTRLAVSLAPNRIATFAYAHVPWMAKRQKMIDESRLPPLDERRRQSKLAAEMLTQAGYEAIGIDHFALPGDSLRKFGRITDPCHRALYNGITGSMR